jgi:hypothetical protein
LLAKATMNNPSHDSQAQAKPSMNVMKDFREPKSESAVRPLQLSAVATLRPKRRWKTSQLSAFPVVAEPLPAPITASPSRAPRLNRSGRSFQVWTSKPVNDHAAPKIPARLKIHELIGQSIRDFLSFAHFSHSHRFVVGPLSYRIFCR